VGTRILELLACIAMREMARHARCTRMAAARRVVAAVLAAE
jgi:hypothetical protein